MFNRFKPWKSPKILKNPQNSKDFRCFSHFQQVQPVSPVQWITPLKTVPNIVAIPLVACERPFQNRSKTVSKSVQITFQDHSPRIRGFECSFRQFNSVKLIGIEVQYYHRSYFFTTIFLSFFSVSAGCWGWAPRFSANSVILQAVSVGLRFFFTFQLVRGFSRW